MFPYRCETFTTANVSVLNVFKTSVDTINASSITSDMTIGANLNGGSLTIGSANSTTINGTNINIGPTNTTRISIGGPNTTVNISSGTFNASYFTMFSSVIDSKPTAWLDTIKSNLNTQLVLGFYNASEVFVGSSKTPNIVIGGEGGTLKIANEGLLSTSKILIASSNTNAVGSEVYVGSTSLTRCFIRAVDVNINHLTGYNIYMGSPDNGITSIVGNVTLGANALTVPTAASTNITLGTANSVFRLYTPITIGYGIPGATSQLGGKVSSNAGSIRLYTSGAIFAPISGVSIGRYIYNMSLYAYWIPQNQCLIMAVASSPNTINNGQSTWGNFYNETGSQHTRGDYPGYLVGTGWQVTASGVVDIGESNVGIVGYALNNYTASYYDINFKLYLTRIG